MRGIRVVLCLALLFTILAPFTSVLAQDSCVQVTILNESNKQIDTQKVCDAAAKFVNEGHQVYVFITDKSVGSTEDDWYAIRDVLEVGWGIYDPSSDEFSKNAVSVELSTDTSKPWGQDFAFGEKLYGTPLDNDSVISQIEGQLKNNVTAATDGDLTAAIVNSFETAYQYGYPPPPPTSAPVTPGPTVIVQGDTTNVQVDTAPIVKGIGTILLVIILFVLGWLFVLYIAIPVGKKILTMSSLMNRVKNLRQRLARLMNTLSGSDTEPGLLTGDTPDATLIYQLWVANGGAKYGKKDREVKEFLRRSQAALSKAYEAWTSLSQTNPEDEAGWNQLVRDLETLYLTIVGTTDRILAMTENEQLSLLDPMTAIPRETTDVLLVSQIDQVVRRHQGAGSLRIVSVDDSIKVDAEGILGYLDQVKVALHEISVARAEGPKLLEEVVALRLKLEGEITLPVVMDGLNAFAYPDKLILAAQKAQGEELWMEVKDDADKTLASLQALPALIATYISALSANAKRQQKIDEISLQKYEFTAAIKKAMGEVTQDVADINAAVLSGDYSKAGEYIRELESDCARALAGLEALVALRSKNEKEIARLAVQVAKVEKNRLYTADTSWLKLKDYPASNWHTVTNFYKEATTTLSLLFDDPANEHDLASNIARTNSMKVQEFTKAEQMLVEAYSQLDEAERKLKAIVDLLVDVEKIERQIAAGIKFAEADVEKARVRRDADNEKIDKIVDKKIDDVDKLIETARKAAKDREFTIASEAVNRARELANQAYSSANEQATTIDALYKQLSSIRVSAETNVNSALKAYSFLIPAAQKASTGGKTTMAQDALRIAVRAEAKIDGEDKALLKSLGLAVDAYVTADRLAKEALEQIREDKGEYEEHVSSVRQAITSAKEAISSANQLVSESDADGAGTTSLRRASDIMPDAPEYGESIDALSRRRRQAEEAESVAQRAASEAQARIREAEEAREEERRRRRAAEEARRAHEVAEASARRRASSSSSSSSYNSSFGNSSSSRSSSMGSSRSSSSSSMGSPRRR